MDLTARIRVVHQRVRENRIVTRMIFVSINVVLATIVVIADAAPSNRTCPIVSGHRQDEERMNYTTNWTGVQSLEETIMQEDYEATYDVIALRTEQHQKGATVDDYKYLYDYLTGTGVHDFNDTIIIGFLGAYGTTQVVLGALPLAIAAVNRDPKLLPNRKLKFLAADIGTNIAANKGRKDSSLAALAISAMTQMRDRGAVAFIGPDDTCSSEGLVAAAWNLPIISYKCAEAVVSDKQVYRTFARTLPPSSKVSKSVVALLKAFEWTQFAVVSGSRPAWGSNQMEAIKELATIHGLTITAEHQYSYYIPSHIAEMERIVEATFARTRVYVFLGEHIALVDFVSCLRRRRLLDNGEYIVISVDDQIYDPRRRHDIIQRTYLDPFLNGSQDLFAFRSVLKLTPSHPSNPDYIEVCEHIKKLSAMPPFCVPNYHRIFESISVPIEAAHLYDAVMIYARALTEALESGEDPRNGTALLNRILSRSYKSIQGYDVFIDASGDAEGNFTVVALLDDMQVNGSLRMSMQPVGYFRYGANNSGMLPEFLYLDPKRPIQWVGGEDPPRAEPACGFFREKCEKPPDWRLLAVTAFVGLTVVVAAIFLLKHYRYEQKLACLLWKIDLRDITIIPIETADSVTRSKSVIQSCRASLLLQGVSQGADSGGAGTQGRAYTQIALYRGNVVALKPVHKKNVDITRAIRKEFKQIREVRHENLLSFIGACVENGHLAIVSPYCARGSLKDVLANRDLHLDGMFVSSLVSDLLKGLVYLHDSEIVSHGNLNSSNCLIDSRWVLQIADYGLHEFKAGQEEPDGALKEERRALWKAPELLRNPSPPPRGSQKGDVYSFSIVLYEIIGRSGPWGHTDLSNAEILGRVRHPIDRVYFRPPLGPLTALGTAPYVLRCMEACWHEESEQRPDIRFVRVRLKEMQQGLKPNIFDNMLAMMEKYAYNLEGLVAERTEQLTQEKKRTDQLLHRMLPKSVAEALKRGEPVQAESFNCVTIYFSDIVGFTELSADSTPMQVVELLNDLYTCCDSIISHYDVYKVETIGDAYMVVSGLPLRNGDKHAGEIASMALHLLERVKRLEVRHRPGTRLKLRIGIHSGQCVAGVVGLKMPRYCLFGDTVNTASRMETAGEPLRIHVSAATVRLLRKLGGYQFTERGLTMIKGKGEMLTFWLEGEEAGRREARAIREISQTSLLASCSSDLGTCDTPDLLRRPGLLAGITNGSYPCSFRGRYSGPLRRCCPARSQELHPQGYGALPLPLAPCSCCGPPGRPHRSAPMVTFRDFDYDL